MFLLRPPLYLVAVFSAISVLISSASLNAASVLYIANHATSQVLYAPLSGGTATQFVSSNSPSGLAFDNSGNLYATDDQNNRIYKYSPSGTLLQTFSGGGLLTPQQIAIDAAGNVYAASLSANKVSRFAPDGSSLGTLDVSDRPTGLAFDSIGNLYVSVSVGGPSNSLIQMFNSSGVAQPDFVSGINGGVAGLAFDSLGNLYLASTDTNSILKYDSDGDFITSFSSHGGLPYGLAFDSADNLYVANLLSGDVALFNSSNVFQSTIVTGLDIPAFLAIGAAPIPEPSTLGILLLALPGLFVLARMRRRAA